MQKTDIQTSKVPDAPGVYFFLGPRKEILYIGKATSLKNRIRSYFSDDIKDKRSELIAQMALAAKRVDWTTTDSVLEALILETNLIRTHKPRYNTRSKDDKSYNHLIITDEEWPRILVVRGKDLVDRFAKEKIKYHFGPFPSGALFREALKIVRKLFKFYDTKVPVEQVRSKLQRGQLDFNRQIGLFPQTSDRAEYLRTIRHIRLFFEGKKALIIKELRRDMMQAAKAERFEEAEVLKRRIFALEHIQDVALIKDDIRQYRDTNSVRIEAYDVAHWEGEAMVGVMTVVEAGEAQPSEYRKFNIKTVDRSNDTAALREVLTRRLTHLEWALPQIVVVDGAAAQKNAAEAVLRGYGLMIPVIAVVKDDRHRPIRLIAPPRLQEQFQNDALLANAEAHRFAINFHRTRRSKRFA